MGGGKSGSTGTTTQNSTVSIPPEVLARYNSVNATAENVAQTPFQPYTGQFVAPVNATQQGGINQIAGAANWIAPTYQNTVGTISSGVAGAQPYYGAAGSNINAGLAGGQSANQAALNQYGQALGAAQPYNTGAAGSYGTAAGLAGAGTGAVNASPLDANAIGQYMSPYNNAVVQSTMALLGQQQGQQRSNQTTSQILGGTFGGDRSGIDQATLAGQQNLASANVLSNLYNQNYSQALGTAQQQQGVGLGAAQANRAALQQGANQFTGLGQAVQGLGQQIYGQGTGQAAFTGQIGQQGYGQALGAAGAQQGLGQAVFGTGLAAAQGYGQAGAQALQGSLAQGQAQLGAGTVQQQTEQANLQAQYNQFLQQQAYPFQTTQFLANIAEGTGALSGSTTSANNYTPQPFFSDRRLKENIKTIAHTKAGIPIVQYNYKGKPGTQIGLIAQDVEKHRPEAVGLAHGYKTVDYEAALKAGGGAVGLAGGGPAMMIYHIGGSVDDDDAGRGFGTGYADGGSPAMDPVAMAQILAAHQSMYPGSTGRGGMDSGPRGMQLHQPSGRSLMKAELIKQPQQQGQSEGRAAAQGLSDIAGAGKSASTIYDMGKDAVVGSAAKGTPDQPGYTPATGGLGGTGGKWDPQNGWFGKVGAGLGAANSNTPTPNDTAPIVSQPLPDITPPAPVDASSSIADSGSSLVDDALGSAWAWRGGRQGRDIGGPTMQDIGDKGAQQAMLVDAVPPGVGKNPFNPGSFAGTEWAKGKPGVPMPAPAAPAANGPLPMIADGSANGATGNADGAVGGSGGVGGSASDGSGSTYREGGVVGHALKLARRPKRYASGGMPYGDSGDGYIPDDLYEPINAAELAKEQKGMEAPLMKESGSGSKGKDGTGKAVGSLVGMGLGSIVGMPGVGGLVGGLAGGLFHGGGRTGYQGGGGPDDDRPAPFLPTDVAEDLPPYEKNNVLPFPDRGLGAARTKDDLPPFKVGTTDTPSPRSLGEINALESRPVRTAAEPPARTSAEPYVEPEWAKKPEITPADFPPAPAVGVAPPTAPSAAPSVPGLAPPTQINVPPGFREPGGGTPDVYNNILMRESGNTHWGSDGQPKRGAAGEVGVGQIMPGTGPIAARDAGLPWNPALFNQAKTGDPVKDKAAEDYHRALSAGHFKALVQTFGGDEAKAAAAYNCGETCVKDAVTKGGADWSRHIPASTRQYVAGVTGGGGSGSRMALNAPASPGLGGAAGTTPGLAPAKDRDFLDRAGDWYDRNERRIVPALAFLGSMLSSPSRTLAGSIGSGLVGGAGALAQQQGLQQGQQRIDITKNSQVMSLWAQVRQMYLASKTQSNPDGDQGLKAQMERLAGMMQQNVGGTGGAAPGAPPPGGPDLPAGGPPPALSPPAQPPSPIVPAGGAAPPGPAPSASPTPGAPTQAVPPNQLPPSMRVPEPKLTPEFYNQLPDTMNPLKLEELGNQLTAAGDPRGQQYLQRANEIKAKINQDGGAVGKDSTFINLPGAKELQLAQARAAENNDWQVKQQPVFQDRQIMKQSVDEIVNQLQRFEPGEFSKIKSDVQAAIRGATGMTPPSTSTMNAEAYQIFLKNAKAIVTAAPSGDANTDAARKLLEDAFTGPDKQPGAVRDVLAKAKGRLEYADEFLKYAQPRIAQEPRLNRTMMATEFEKEHPLQNFVDHNYDSMAVRGHLPEPIKDGKVPNDVVNKAYIMTPAEVQKFVGRGSLDEIRNNSELGFGGNNEAKRFRVIVKDGRAQLVAQ